MQSNRPPLRRTMLHVAAAGIAAALALATPARAATLAGVTLPDSYSVAGKPLVLNGIGLRTLTILNVHVYVAGLYVPQPTHDANAILRSPGPKAIMLYFLHSGSKEAIDRQFRAGMANNCGHGECDPSDQKDYDALIAASPAVNVGDTSTYIFDGAHVTVYANQRRIADFTNKDLAYRILAGFIGEHPPSEELKAELLGQAAR